MYILYLETGHLFVVSLDINKILPSIEPCAVISTLKDRFINGWGCRLWPRGQYT